MAEVFQEPYNNPELRQMFFNGEIPLAGAGQTAIGEGKKLPMVRRTWRGKEPPSDPFDVGRFECRGNCVTLINQAFEIQPGKQKHEFVERVT